MTDWERLKFDEFKWYVENSPTLNNSKKRMFERMLDEMESEWENRKIKSESN